MDQSTANRTETLVDAHLAAYCEPDAGRRQQAIARLWNREGRLVDPPFEEAGEFDRLAEGLAKAHRRWPGGIYALWYPIKDREAVAAFRRRLARSGIPKLLDIAFEVGPPAAEPRLHGSGMVVANPPFTLEGELATLLPALHGVLARENPSRWTMEWLAGEKG